MNCREAERHIYLYRELSPLEREETDRHITTCAGCARLSALVKVQSSMIIAASKVTPELRDATRMSQSIMASIHERKHKTQRMLSGIWQVRSFDLLRYGMAMVSVLLTVVFFTEYNADTSVVRPHKLIPSQRNIELNSASFHAVFIEQREAVKSKSKLLYECIASCMYTPDADCKGCKKQIAKLN